MSSPTANQKRFIGYMADLGCCVSNQSHSIQMHHIFGRETKVKGVGNIGHWAVIPLAADYHDVNSDDPFNVTHHKNAFENRFGTQVRLWVDRYEVIRKLAFSDYRVDINSVPSLDIVDAIYHYRK